MLKKEIQPGLLATILVVLVILLALWGYRAIRGPSKTGTHSMKAMFSGHAGLTGSAANGNQATAP
ncbi:MAG: hypothetical protein M1330_04090 [Armatimonadetes bacterium]|nr:hypothetical protein [Armatimonadota bacterium]